MGIAVWRVTEKPKKINWQWGHCFRWWAGPKIGGRCRKWSQNGRQGLSRKPRASNRDSVLIARGPAARRGRQRPVPAETDHPGRGVNTGGSFIGASPVWAAPMKRGRRHGAATQFAFTKTAFLVEVLTWIACLQITVVDEKDRLRRT